MFGNLASFILAHKRIVGLLIAVGVLVLGAGARRLTADFSVDGFFASNDVETTYLQGYRDRWGGDDRRLVVVIDGGGKTLLTRDRLERIYALVHTLEALPAVKSAVSATSLSPQGERMGWAYIPTPLLSAVPTRPDAMAAWRANLLKDPRFVPSFLSDDGEWGAVMVELDVDLGDLVAVRTAVHAVESALAAAETDGDLQFRVAGTPALRAHVLEVMLADQVVFLPVSFGLITLVLALLFRSVHGVLIPIAAAAVPTAMLFGFMGYTGEPLGLLNQVYLVLIPSIAVADAIHLVARFHEEARTAPKPDLQAAIIETMDHMGVAILLTSVTTLVGFLSLNATRMQVLRSFGTYASVGIALSYGTALILLPLTLRGVRRMKSHNAKSRDGDSVWLGALLARMTRGTLRHPWSVLGATAIVFGVALIYAAQVSVDFAVTETYEPSYPVSIANEEVDAHLGGLLAIELELYSEEGALSHADALQAVWRAEEALKANPEVRSTLGIASYLAFVSTMMGGPNLPPATDRAAASVYAFADKLEGSSRLIKPDRKRARVLVRTVDLGATQFEALAERLTAEVSADLAPYGITVHATGANLLAYRGLARVSRDLVKSLLGAAGFIAVVIALLFRSLRFGLLSLVPNAIPLVMGYGLLGGLGWSLDPAPAVVFSVALGIAVDSTIHVLARYREERKHESLQPEAIIAAVQHSGPAIAVTAAILVLGIGINAFSSFPANVTFGVLGAFILTVALVGNLVVLPALLSVADRT